MTQPCVRGCLRPCPCPTCKGADEPEHDPQPAPAEDGYLCRRDRTRLFRWLGSVLDDTLRLDSRLPADYGWDKGNGHQKVTGSPALVRLDVAALTDRRSAFGVVGTGDPEGHEPKDYEENRDLNPPLDIAGEVCSWARIFTEEQQLSSPVNTMAAAVAVLTAWWDTLVKQPWVDDFYASMAEIRKQLDLAHNVERPKPMGQCFTCEAALYSRPGCTDIRCGKCGRRYDGLGIVRLEVQRRREARA